MRCLSNMFRTHKPKVTFTPHPGVTVERRIGRCARLQRSIDKAVARGDHRRAGRLTEELEALKGGLLEEKADIDAMLRAEEAS